MGSILRFVFPNAKDNELLIKFLSNKDLSLGIRLSMLTETY